MPIDPQAIVTQVAPPKPARSISESKAFLTDQNARLIMQVETDAREAKTLRLRKERLDLEQFITPPVTKVKKTRK